MSCTIWWLIEVIWKVIKWAQAFNSYWCFLFRLLLSFFSFCTKFVSWVMCLHWLSYSSFECVKLKRTGFFSRRHSMPWFIFWSWGVLLYAKLVLSHAMLIYLRFLDCSTYHVMETSSSDNCDNIMIIHPSPPLGRTFDVPITSKSFASLHIKNQISK